MFAGDDRERPHILVRTLQADCYPFHCQFQIQAAEMSEPFGYYAYIMGRDGHIQDRVDIACSDEEEAKRRAKQLVDGHAVELWQEARRIDRFEP